MKSLRSGLKLSLLGQAINGALSFLGLAVWARFSDQSTLASIFIPLSFIAILIDLIDFGGNSWINREVVHSNLESGRVWEFLVPKVKFTFTLSGSIAIAMLIGNTPKSLILLVIIYPQFSLLMAYFQGSCLRTAKYFDAFIAQFLERICWFLPILLLNFLDSKFDSIAYSIVIGAGFSSVYIYRMILRDYSAENRRLRSRYSAVQTYRLSSKLGFASVISDLYAIDSYLVQKFSGSTEAGGFSLVQKNRNFAVLGFAVFGAKLRLAMSHSKDEAKKLILSEWEILFVNIIGLLIVYFFSSNFIDFFYGHHYSNLTPILRVGILIFLCSGICIVLQAFLSGSRDDAFISFFAGISVFLSLLAISIGSLVSGALGASIGLLISFFGQLSVLIIRSYRLFKT